MIHNLILAVLILFFVWPLMTVIGLLIEFTSKGSMIFTQKRIGKNGKVFMMYKFRTMYVGAEKDRNEYKKLNEADGPVFKIRKDPRFVGIGRFLARTGLDELPQLVNILKGEMNFVGPRPLPVYEYNRLKLWQKKRQSVLPGITSSWVINGKHKISFDKWMKSDLEYIKNKSFIGDLRIIWGTFVLIISCFISQFKLFFSKG